MRERTFLAFLTFICVSFGFIALASIIGDGPIIDEVEHIASGYFYLRTGLNSLNTTQPLLVKVWSALALLPFPFNDGFNFPFRTDGSSGASYAYNFLYDVPNSPVAMIGLGRAAVIGLNAILLWVLGFKLSQIIGRKSALISIILLIISPTFFSHSRYITNDVCVSLLISVALVLIASSMGRPNIRNPILSFLALALAIQAKFSALVLFPVVLAFIILFASGRTRTKYLTGFLVISVLLSFLLVCTYWGMSTRSRTTGGVTLSLKSQYWIPENGLDAVKRGILYQVSRLNQGGAEPGYLAGNIYSGGDPRFFTTLLFLKEPIGWLLFVAVGLAALQIKWRQYIEQDFPSPFRSLMTLNVIMICIYGITAIFSNLNIGIRHLLPIYPALIVLATVGISKLHDVRFLRVKYLLIGLTFAAWLSAFPHFLSFFNFFSGSYPQFWAVDSNFDWGQDSIRLVKWISSNKRGEVVFVDYFGRGHPLHYLREKMASWSSSMGKPPGGSTLFVSSTRIQQARGRRLNSVWGLNYEWLDDLEPVETIGKTILVYKVPR